MPDPQPVPINAKFDEEFVTQLVVVLDTDTMREVAAKVAQHVVGKLHQFLQLENGIPISSCSNCFLTLTPCCTALAKVQDWAQI